MSRKKLQNPRPLGYVGCIPKTPQVNSLNITKLLPIPQSNTDKFIKLKEGCRDNVVYLSTPPEDVKDTPLPVSEEPRSDKNIVKHSDLSQPAVDSHEKCKKTIDDGLKREKELRDQTEVLGRQMEELKVTLCSKEEESKQLKNQLQTQEARLNEEQVTHIVTRAILHETKEKLMVAHESIERLTEEHRKDIEIHTEESEKHLAEMMAGKDSVIADRDQKLARLKSQMADTLKGNSWERQQQLDELTKELSRMQEENDILRMSIKSMKKTK